MYVQKDLSLRPLRYPGPSDIRSSARHNFGQFQAPCAAARARSRHAAFDRGSRGSPAAHAMPRPRRLCKTGVSRPHGSFGVRGLFCLCFGLSSKMYIDIGVEATPSLTAQGATVLRNRASIAASCFQADASTSLQGQRHHQPPQQLVGPCLAATSPRTRPDVAESGCRGFVAQKSPWKHLLPIYTEEEDGEQPA